MIQFPVYLVIDTSASMAGTIHDLNNNLRAFIEGLSHNPVVADRVGVSILTFSSSAETPVPMTALHDLVLPTIGAGGGTSYGAALHLLRESIIRDVDTLRKKGHRVYRPLAFFISDGTPTDPGWRHACDELHNPSFRYSPTVIAIGFYSADPEILRAVAGPRGHAFTVIEEAPDPISSTFVGLGKTVVATATSSMSGADAVPMPVPPEWIDLTSDMI